MQLAQRFSSYVADRTKRGRAARGTPEVRIEIFKVPRPLCAFAARLKRPLLDGDTKHSDLELLEHDV